MKIKFFFVCLIIISFVIFQVFFNEVDSRPLDNNLLVSSYSSQSSDSNHVSISLASQGVQSSSVSSSISYQNKEAHKSFFEAWIPVQHNQADVEKIGSLIGSGQQNSEYQFIQINVEYLDSVKEGDVFELKIPGSNAIDVAVTNVSNFDGGRSIIGHLSNYPQSYYVGLNYDRNGNTVGEITTEKGNYGIRTYSDKTVIFKVIVDPEKYKQDDF